MNAREAIEGRLGTKQVLPPLEPSWIMRLVFIVFGLAAILVEFAVRVDSQNCEDRANSNFEHILYQADQD